MLALIDMPDRTAPLKATFSRWPPPWCTAKP